METTHVQTRETLAQSRAARPDADDLRPTPLRTARHALRRARTPHWTVISPSTPRTETRTDLGVRRLPRARYRLLRWSVPGAAVTPPPWIAILFGSPVQERHVQKDPIVQRLVEAYPGLRWQLRRRLRDKAVVDDMLNAASAIAIDKFRAGHISDPARIAGYVFRVAMNLYRNHVREHDNRTDLRADEDDLQEIACEHTPQDEALDGKLAEQIRAIVAELPRWRDRQIIVRLYLEEESKESICAALDIDPSHFDKVAFRTRQRLRVLLEREGITKEVLNNV